MRRILITGSNGLLGQKLIKLLLEKPEYEVLATARGENRLPFKDGYRYAQMDITKKAEVESVIEDFKPHLLINTAAMTNVDQCEDAKEECWQQNVEAVGYMVAACIKIDCYLLHVSTDFIFDGSKGPLDEKAEANPISFYGWSKWAAEKTVIHSGIRWGIARTVLVYGIAADMSRSNIILWVKNSLENGKKISVVTDQWRTPTLAEDLAEGCFLMAQKEAEGIFNISGKDFMNPYDMAMATADFFKLDKSLITKADASSFTQRAKRPPITGFHIDKAREILGYEPHSFQEGIKILSEQLQFQ